MGLPARSQRPHPFRIGRLVAALVNRRRRALEHVELLGVLAQMRDALDRGRARPDDSHAFVSELMQAAGGIAAGIVIIPAAGVERMPLELLDPRNRRELGPIQRTARHDYVARGENIAAIGFDRPALFLIVPTGLSDLRLEAGPLV